MNNKNWVQETVIVICEGPTCQGCCYFSHCFRSHFPSSGSDVAGAPPLLEVEEQGDPLSARCPETSAARPARSPPPSHWPLSLPLLAVLTVEYVPPRGGNPGGLEGEGVQVQCCSPNRCLFVVWRYCRCSGPLSLASRLAGNDFQKSYRPKERYFKNDSVITIQNVWIEKKRCKR